MRKFDSTLWDLLKSATTLKMKQRVEIICRVLDGLIYVQNKGVVHLDIKPANIMVDKNANGEWDGKTVIIVDFGLSTTFDCLKGNAGTPGFGSPEQFLGKPSYKSDNYGLGKTGIITIFPWQSAWNFLAQPVEDGEISEVENSPLLKPFHGMISALLSVSIFTLRVWHYEHLQALVGTTIYHPIF